MVIIYIIAGILLVTGMLCSLIYVTTGACFLWATLLPISAMLLLGAFKTQK